MMQVQNKSKILITIIAILLITNIAMVSFFILKKDGDRQGKHHDRKTLVTNFLKNEIGFNEAQLKAYDMLSDEHRKRVKGMFDSLKGTKEKQFEQLAAGNFNDSIISQVADQSALSQKMMEVQMFNHFKNVRKLCQPEQLPKFDSLFVKILYKRGNEGRKKASVN